MNPVANSSKPTMPPLLSERTLHVCILSAFAFSEPLFAVLTQQLVYLHDIQAGWAEIGFVGLILSVVFPVVLVILDRGLIWLTSLWGGRGKNCLMAVLSFLVCLSVLRPFLRFEILQENCVVWLVTLVIAVPLCVLFMFFYGRSQLLRHWLSAAAIGLVCFPGLFAYRYAMLRRADDVERQEFLKHKPAVQNPVPVIMVVFDEFSGTVLMDEKLKLDSRHFPNFARLGELSTWYRNSSTVADRTDVAVPAILSGQFPAVKRPPLEAEFPGNLFQTIRATDAYEMIVFEPITRLCPKAVRVRQHAKRTFREKIDSLAQTLSSVYPRLILPSDAPVPFPPISRLWFGIPDEFEDDSNSRTGLIRNGAFIRRDRQLSQFIDCIRAKERPQFCFLHVELPHVPWYYLPSGDYTNYEIGREFDPAGSRGDLGEDWEPDPSLIARNEHRQLLQVQFVDRFIGQLLDHLQKEKLLDESLLIVTADHGVAFRPGHSRRVADRENLPDILSVPLFVKLPGQTKGATSDANVESVDILPTIAQVLGMPLSQPVDGTAVTEETRRLRKCLYVNHVMTVVEPVIPRLEAAIARRTSIFGDGSWDQPPALTATHPDWHGRSISEFPREEQRLQGVVAYDPQPFRDAGDKMVPCLVRGYVDKRRLPTSVADLVVAVNGVICDSGRSFLYRFGNVEFEFLLPEATVKQTPCHVEVFLVEGEAGHPRLRPVADWDLTKFQ